MAKMGERFKRRFKRFKAAVFTSFFRGKLVEYVQEHVGCSLEEAKQRVASMNDDLIAEGIASSDAPDPPADDSGGILNWIKAHWQLILQFILSVAPFLLMKSVKTFCDEPADTGDDDAEDKVNADPESDEDDDEE